MPTPILTLLHQRLPGLTPAEQRVANHILARPALVHTQTITQLAAESNSSLGTIARFAKTLGFASYSEFRTALAVDAGRDEAGRARFQISESAVEPGDDAATTISKIAFHEAATIEQTARDLDIATLETVVERIAGARRIDIYGTASSGLAGHDLQQKLHRVGLFAQCWTDHHLALTSAALLTEQDVAIAISHSGRTLDMVQVLDVAANTGAATVAITNSPESPLARSASLVLGTSASDTPYRSGAMSSRIAQLAVIDFLFVRIAQRDYETVSANLQLTFDAVDAYRID